MTIHHPHRQSVMDLQDMQIVPHASVICDEDEPLDIEAERRAAQYYDIMSELGDVTYRREMCRRAYQQTQSELDALVHKDMRFFGAECISRMSDGTYILISSSQLELLSYILTALNQRNIKVIELTRKIWMASWPTEADRRQYLEKLKLPAKKLLTVINIHNLSLEEGEDGCIHGIDVYCPFLQGEALQAKWMSSVLHMARGAKWPAQSDENQRRMIDVKLLSVVPDEFARAANQEARARAHARVPRTTRPVSLLAMR